MSAECGKCGNDLVGVMEDAYCPVCRCEREAQSLADEGNRLAGLLHDANEREKRLEAEIERLRQAGTNIRFWLARTPSDRPPFG